MLIAIDLYNKARLKYSHDLQYKFAPPPPPPPPNYVVFYQPAPLTQTLDGKHPVQEHFLAEMIQILLLLLLLLL